jgi:predicted anti-sigma-YlaC factor YlaD
MDGEQEQVSREAVDRHLVTCTDCRSWYGKAGAMRRMMTVRAAPAVPDLTDTILERIPAPTGEKWLARIGLGVVAIGQLTLSTAQFLGIGTGMGGMRNGGSMMDHLTHESTAWNVAVGVGLLWAALRTRAAAGQLPLLTGFVLVLTVLSAGDLIGHEVTAWRVLSHGLIVLGLVLLYVVHRQNRHDHHPNPVAGDALVTESGALDFSAGVDLPPGVEERHRHRPWSRPASRRRAA